MSNLAILCRQNTASAESTNETPTPDSSRETRRVVSMGDAIWRDSQEPMRVTDEQGVVVDVNEAYCRLVGQVRTSLVGRTFDVVYAPEVDHSALLQKYRRRFQAFQLLPTMSRLITLATGKELFLEVSNSFITLDDGRICVLSVSRDHTEQRRIEESLRASESRNRSLTESATDAIVTCDSEGRITSWNGAAKAMFGYETVDVLGKPAQMLVPERYRRLTTLAFGRSLFRTQENAVRRTAELVGLSRTGKDFPVELSLSSWLTTDGAAFSVIFRDITSRKKIEERLRQSEERFQGIFDNAVQGMFQSTPAGKLIVANKSLLTLLGFNSVEELAAVNMSDLYVEPEQRSRHLSQLVSHGRCSNVELELRRKDGRLITVLEHSRMVKDDQGSPVLMEGILEDITERKELEARAAEFLDALRSSQASLADAIAHKDRLLSIVSHDLRSPFTSILGFCEILLGEHETLSPSERVEFVSYIQSSAQQQLALLNKLLEWSRLQSGRIKPDMNRVDLGAIGRTSVASEAGTALKKRIEVRSEIPDGTEIRGDADLLGQMFSNLISNALKFTKEGGHIVLQLNKGSAGEWLVSVSDSGIGIPAEDVGKLFKVEEHYTRKGLQGEAGTGFGLSVVAEIIQRHSGTITVESEVGRGTTFLIRLPRWIEPSAVREGCVLVVDDDPGIRALHARYIKRTRPELEVIQAADGLEGFRMAQEQHPLLVMTDYSMPGSNGFQLLGRIKADPNTQDIPVVVVTGRESTASMEALRLKGAHATLTKPVSADAVRDILESVLAA